VKQQLIVRPDGRGEWTVSGEGVHFWSTCDDKESTLYVAHQARNQWYPRARVVVDELTPREERFRRRERNAQMWSDHNA